VTGVPRSALPVAPAVRGMTPIEEVYRAALVERTRERVPPDWAATQKNLGIALFALGRRESGTGLLKQVIAACEACLTVGEPIWRQAKVQALHFMIGATQSEISRREARAH